LFVFEANAAMRHNFAHAQNFPHTEPHLKRISDAFENMIQSRLNFA
jgi:CHASE3 domain sensor protein